MNEDAELRNAPSSDDDAPAPPAGSGLDELWRQLAAEPRWKKVLLALAVALMLLGVVLKIVEPAPANDLSTSQQHGQGPGHGSTDGATGLVPTGTGTGTGTGEGGTDPGQDDSNLSPVFLRLGFSFFVGFALGFALRAFLSLTLLFLGLLLLVLFGLSYVEWVTVNWDTMGANFDRFIEHVKLESGAFKTFVTGSLPSAGLGGLGLFAGFRRK